jgi:hypothetical protein
VLSAPPYIAQWINEHPRWQVTRWRCDYPNRKSSTFCGSAQSAKCDAFLQER